MPQKVGKKVGIHFYENVLSEIKLPLKLHFSTANANAESKMF